MPANMQHRYEPDSAKLELQRFPLAKDAKRGLVLSMIELAAYGNRASWLLEITWDAIVWFDHPAKRSNASTMASKNALSIRTSILPEAGFARTVAQYVLEGVGTVMR